uniref:Uncharacterized protein n=1 Tax=uncultured marine virus TaxID=186617 RepID=A0A0F7L598_9VIRU|nr:hypothetical protein [uncultured marine virus]
MMWTRALSCVTSSSYVGDAMRCDLLRYRGGLCGYRFICVFARRGVYHLFDGVVLDCIVLVHGVP